MKPFVSIIIPAYNEASRIGNSLNRIISYMNNSKYSYEIIVSDDGSRDETIAISESFDEVRVVTEGKNFGKGRAVRRGILAAKGTIRIFTDADLSTPIQEIEKLLAELQKGYDVVIGSRAVNDDLIRKHQPFYREFMGKTFNKIVQVLVLKGISDTQCGFKGFTEKAAEDIFLRAKMDGFSFDVEILFLADKLGYRIKETAVEWYNDERSTVSPVVDSIRMFKDITRIKKLHAGSFVEPK